MNIMEVFLCKQNRHKSSDKLDIAFERLQKAIHDFLEMPKKDAHKETVTQEDQTIIVLPMSRIRQPRK